jgi:hypothetical protein
VIDFAAIRQAATGTKPAPAPEPTTPEVAPVVRETVRVTAVAGAAYLLKEDGSWSWEDLRDYVMSQIEQYHGPQVRNTTKEAAVFRSSLDRHGDKGVRIARYAFEVNRGMWQRAPISVNRFCKGSDPYFADKIKSRLA